MKARSRFATLRYLPVFTLAVFALTFGLFFANAAPASAAATTVAVGNNWFGNSGSVGAVFTVDIQVGDAVEWVWEPGAISHTVTETADFNTPNGGADVGDSGITTAGHGPITFNNPGSFDYYCFLHPAQMRGRVNVAAPPAAAAVIPVGNNWFGNSGAVNTVFTVGITAGSTIEWVWEPGAISHTVTETSDFTMPNGGTDVGDSGITTAGYGPITFNNSGAFDYYCFLHPAQMRGRVNVTGGSGGGGGGPGPIVTSRTSLVAIGQPPGDDEDTFVLPSITISSGDTVSWGLAYGTHSVYSGETDSADTSSYQSPGGKAGMPETTSSFSRVFTAPGTYTYYCEEHSGESQARLDRIDEEIADGKMVGKIVVLAADTTGPAASGLSVSPNPADAVSSVTVTATITDLGTPNSIIINAEAFIGSAGSDGSGTYLPVVDGGWDATTEDVSGNVSIAGLPVGGHTIFVHGQDQRGNWGPTQTILLTTTSSGSLANTTNPVNLPSVSLDAPGEVVTASPNAWRATDTTGSGAGWNVAITSTDFSSPSGNIAVSNFKVRLLASDIAAVAGAGAPPETQVPTYVALSQTVPLKILAASPGAGAGMYEYVPGFQLAIPGETVPGSYTASLVVTISSGP